MNKKQKPKKRQREKDDDDMDIENEEDEFNLEKKIDDEIENVEFNFSNILEND